MLDPKCIKRSVDALPVQSDSPSILGMYVCRYTVEDRDMDVAKNLYVGSQDKP